MMAAKRDQSFFVDHRNYAVVLVCGLVALLTSLATPANRPLQAQPATAPIGPAETDAAASADRNEPGDKWVRLLRNPDGKVAAMQTAIVRYVGADDGAGAQDIAVDLIGAVHVGDLKYYQHLNRRFQSYDALLYELVAPEGTVVERGRGTSSAHPLGALQNGLKGMLELEHQLEHVDYTRKNFVHADMSPEEFSNTMTERNEGFIQMYFRMLGQSIAQQSQMAAQGESAELDLWAALFSRDRARQLKIAMAKQFENMEAMMVALSGPNGSTIITERNKKALEVLEDQLALGKKRIGIFYGAGHLSDMDERLRNDFALHPEQVTWIDAWDLRE